MLAVLLLWLGIQTPTHASIPPVPSLSESERISLRFRLENLWNEMEMLHRNTKSDALDLRRQAREFQMFAIFDRIPFTPRVPELTRELTDTAHARGIAISSVKLVERSGPPNPPVPPQIFSDDRDFELKPRQIAEELDFEIRGNGASQAVSDWVASWKSDLTRIIEPLGQPVYSFKGWSLRARAYRFQNIRFPKLKPRDPVALLPDWGKKEPRLFAQREPQLWGFVTRIRKRELTDRLLRKPYQNRGEFLLNGARMTFFLSKDPE